MSFLIDTNVISEVRKGERCDPRVAAWYGTVPDDEVFLSALVLGELRKGVELSRTKDVAKAIALENWLNLVEAQFAGRVLGVDRAVADRWGRMSALRPVPVIDGCWRRPPWFMVLPWQRAMNGTSRDWARRWLIRFGLVSRLTRRSGVEFGVKHTRGIIRDDAVHQRRQALEIGLAVHRPGQNLKT